MEVRTEKMAGTAARLIGLVSRQKGSNNLEVPFDQLGFRHADPNCSTCAGIFSCRSWIPSL
jgi:hypothetical protein